MKKLTLCLMAGLIAVPALSSARTYPHATAKVQIDIPDNWKTETDEDTLAAEAPDGNLALFFGVMKATELDAALEALDEELSALVQNLRPTGEVEKITINGMEGALIEGKGTVDGTAIEVALVILVTRGGKVLVGLGMGTPDAVKRYDPDIERIFKSIRPI